MALKEYEKKYRDGTYKISSQSERYPKEWLYLDTNFNPSAPIYYKKDMDIIRDFVDKMSTRIFTVIYKNLDRTQNIFRKCKASKYANFAEFFCWLYHLTFTETMDYLIRKQKLRPPACGYEYWIWKNEFSQNKIILLVNIKSIKVDVCIVCIGAYNHLLIFIVNIHHW